MKILFTLLTLFSLSFGTDFPSTGNYVPIATNNQVQETVITSEDIEKKYVIEKPDAESLPIKLPTVKDGYFPKLLKINYTTGEVKIGIFELNNLEMVATYHYVHTGIIKLVSATEKEIESTVKTLDILPKYDFKIEKIEPKSKYQLNLTDLIIAVLFIDNEKIDIEESLLKNRLTLQSGYSLSFNQDTLDESIFIFYLTFLAQADELLLQVNGWLLLTILPISFLLTTGKKLSTSIQDIHDNEDMIEKGVITVLLISLFYIVQIQVPVNSSKISKTNFNVYLTEYVEKGANWAYDISRMFASSYTNIQRKNSGMLSADEVKRLAIENITNQKQLGEFESIIAICKNDIDTTLLSTFAQTPNGNIFQAKLRDGISENSFFKRENKREGFLTSSATLSLCSDAETNIKLLSKSIAENKRIIANYQASKQDNRTKNQLQKLQVNQIKAIDEYGFLASPLIATTNMFSKNLSMFNRDVKSQDEIEEAREKENKENGNEKGVIADSVVGDVIQTLPVMLIPGTDTVKKGIEGVIGTATSKFEKIPFVGELVKSVKSLTGMALTIYIFQYLITYLPIVVLIISSYLVTIYFFLSLIVYLFVSPYIVLFALSRGQDEKVKDFLIKGAVLITKPLILVFSIIICVIAIDLLHIVTSMLIEQQFNSFFNITMNQDKLTTTYMFSDYGLLFLKGFIALAMSLAGAVMAFYIVFYGSDIVTKMLGLNDSQTSDTQSVVGRDTTISSGKFNRPLTH